MLGDPKMDEVLKQYLFTEGSIVGCEAAAAYAPATAGDTSLGIGSLKARAGGL